MKKLQSAALLLLLPLIAMVGLGIEYQIQIRGGVKATGEFAVEPTPPSGGSSVGPAGVIQASNGAGALQAAVSGAGNNCTVDPGGLSLNCSTQTMTSRQVSGPCAAGTCTCQLFPDQSYFNTNVSAYPQDANSQTYVSSSSYLADALLPITDATWAAGTATLTVGSTASILSGHAYNVTGTKSASCSAGTDCGFNDQVSSLGNTGYSYALTVVNGTTLTYPLTGNPGAYTSGGSVHYNGSGAVWNTSYTSDQLIGLFHHVPNMVLNLARNTTATLNPANVVWTSGEVPTQSDNGPYPWTSSFLMEGFNDFLAGGFIPVTVQDAIAVAGDNHVFSINMDTCTLYETYDLTTDGPPWNINNGAIWNLNSLDLRTAQLVNFYGNDSSGLTSGDVAGLPLWPLVLTYAEMFSGNPIQHVIRVGLPAQLHGNNNGFHWPGSHGSNGSPLTGGLPLGSRWILNPTFDVSTCHFRDCAGMAFPSWMTTFLTALQNYGIIFADNGGGFVSVISDYSPNWGAGDDCGTACGTTTNGGLGSYTYQFTGFMHGIEWSDGIVIDPKIHTVNVNSQAVR